MLKFQLCALFFFGYIAIVFEHIVRVNKSAVALVMGGANVASLFLSYGSCEFIDFC